MLTPTYEEKEEVRKQYNGLRKRLDLLSQELRLLIREHQPCMVDEWECGLTTEVMSTPGPTPEDKEQRKLVHIQMKWLESALTEEGLVKRGKMTAAGRKAFAAIVAMWDAKAKAEREAEYERNQLAALDVTAPGTVSN